MRVIIFIIASVLLIVGFGIWSAETINAAAQDLAQHLNRLEHNISKEDWHSSAEDAELLSQAWSKTKDNWTLYLDHQEIENIDLTYARLRQFIETKDLSSALAEVAALKLLVKHIPELSAFNLQNIF